jgi:hypothetical protein
MEMLVRFTVDPKDLDRTVSDLLSDNEKLYGGSYVSASIADGPRPPEFKEFLPMPWWNPGSITNGYYRGTKNGRPVDIWVDVAQHTIYLCETD